MVPAFRAGDFSGGISRAVDDIITVLEGNAAELEQRAERKPAPHNDDDDLDPVVVLFFIVWGTLFFGGFAMAILPPALRQEDRPEQVPLARHGHHRGRQLVRLRLVQRLLGQQLVVGQFVGRRLLRRGRVVRRRRLLGKLVRTTCAIPH